MPDSSLGPTNNHGCPREEVMIRRFRQLQFSFIYPRDCRARLGLEPCSGLKYNKLNCFIAASCIYMCYVPLNQTLIWRNLTLILDSDIFICVYTLDSSLSYVTTHGSSTASGNNSNDKMQEMTMDVDGLD